MRWGMREGIETLKEMQNPGVWEAIERSAVRVAAGLSAAAEEARVHAVTQRVGTMFTTFFTDRPVTNWATAKTADTQKFGAFFRGMLEDGVYLAPSQFEAGFLSAAHGEAEINATLAAAARALARIHG